MPFAGELYIEFRLRYACRCSPSSSSSHALSCFKMNDNFHVFYELLVIIAYEKNIYLLLWNYINYFWRSIKKYLAVCRGGNAMSVEGVCFVGGGI